MLSESAKVAIVAALEREIALLVKGWRVSYREHESRRFKFFESDQSVLVCGGIGSEPARRATESVIALYRPEVVVSAGFAGALDRTLKIGQIVCPLRVIDAKDGSSVKTGIGTGVLVSFGTITSVEQKARLAESHEAQAVDMEAAAVAKGAQARGLQFAAVKAISDVADFEMPSMERFVTPDGQLRTAKFVVFATIRPWLWPRVIRLARNSAKASRALCRELELYTRGVEKLGKPGPELYPISGARH